MAATASQKRKNIIKNLEEMGVKFDRRWSTDRLGNLVVDHRMNPTNEDGKWKHPDKRLPHEIDWALFRIQREFSLPIARQLGDYLVTHTPKK